MLTASLEAPYWTPWRAPLIWSILSETPDPYHHQVYSDYVHVASAGFLSATPELAPKYLLSKSHEYFTPKENDETSCNCFKWERENFFF
jgi:hypothetical protein